MLISLRILKKDYDMSENKEIFLKDYKEPYFWIKNIDLDIDIYENETFVLCELTIERNKKFSEKYDLILDGHDMKLLNIELNNVPLHDDHYEVYDEKLIIKTHEDSFTLSTKVEIHPEKNLSGEGLYQSGAIFCTQCEAEGFRKITYYLDRPDVMASFKTTVRGDKKQFPVLLSNGNKIDSGDLDNGRHYTTWEDPFKKPAYLFAAVAGDLALVKDTYKTTSGRNVALEIFVDHGNEDKTHHAMESLKNSMKWDEDVFGLEYDLDIYMIVAVDSFNMGAMENKGLNIFNSAYVLAKQETATDRDFQGVEGVIGHEYFHNWTGNRVTCRDWFQLTLKEGLTVFRDQEFSSDMLSREVKRIEDVQGLRNFQFPEDAGPMSHPIKPKSYIEINNFYSATVYEKGAEVIRMIHTILGKENFRKGMDLYFQRHDGQAVTTEDFVAAMSDASGIDLKQFKVWYDQNGTPRLDIHSQYDENKKEFSFTIKQSATLNNDQFNALHIPFRYGLLDSDGKEIELADGGMIQLKKPEETFVVKSETAPTPSWNRGFSAPVVVNYELNDDQLTFLMANDCDAYNRYDSAVSLYQKEIIKMVQLEEGEELGLNEKLSQAFGAILKDKIDPSFKSLILTLPTEDYINEQLPIHDYENVYTAIEFLKSTLANEHLETIVDMYNDLNNVKEFKLDAYSMGQRALKNTLLSYIAASDLEDKEELLKAQFINANNMTDELAAFKNIVHTFEEIDETVEKFKQKWQKEELVMQKWIAVQAMRPGITVTDMQALENNGVYNNKIPNYVRSLLRSFLRGNPRAFNAEDGSGYKYIADKIIEIDAYNPQIASGLSRSLRHLKHLDEGRASKLKEQLQRLLDQKLSKDTFEVISRNLNN